MGARNYFVYILANRPDGALYTGVTNDLKRRVFEHKTKAGGGFTMRYNVDRLVYFEVFDDSLAAITREKQIKAGPRKKKVELIESVNRRWIDLYDEL
jgi:putative endonuclease